MNRTLICFLSLLFVALPALSAEEKPGTAAGSRLNAGVSFVDITPKEEITLAGSPSPKKTSTVGTPLFAKALVLSAEGQKVAIVTLDTLKYPMSLALQARQQIEQNTGIPFGNVIICASHTHSGPLWSYYHDKLITPIVQAVEQAASDLEPCQLGVAEGRVEGVSENRRVLKDGTTWNRWVLPPAEAERYPAEGPADPECGVLAVVGNDGRYKAILFNFACHATNNRVPTISADYPGDVQQFIRANLGYDVPTLFLTGACGDVSPARGAKTGDLGRTLGEEILRSLGRLAFIVKPTLSIQSQQRELPGRENPQFKEAEIALKWPAQLEHYRMAFSAMKRREQPTYPCPFTGIRVGDDFAIVTNPVELFCAIGLDIKRQSPFKHTMVVEQTNGAHGYVPTASAFGGGGYETWFGEHSYLSTQAGEIIEHESLDLLNRLKHAP